MLKPELIRDTDKIDREAYDEIIKRNPDAKKYMKNPPVSENRKKAKTNFSKEDKILYVKSVIENGSNKSLLGTEMPMPDRNLLFNLNTQNIISDAEIETLSNYVANGMTGAGADVFAGTCAACHGEDGKGMEYVAPRINSGSFKGMID